MPLFGVDVSSHKGTVDWAKVRAAGFTFAINRACIDTKPDATWAANHKAVKAAGLIPGAYHFLYPSSGASAARPAADQCDAFLDVIGDPEGMIVALDVESDGAGIYQPRFSDVTAWVSRFRHFWPKHPIVIYSGAWYWDSTSHPIHNADGSSIGPLWDSHYVQGAAATAGVLYGRTAASWWGQRYGGWDHVTILQFSSSGLVPGVSGTCDVNAFRGTTAELRGLASNSGIAATPVPQEADMILAHYRPGSTITVKPTANIRADTKLTAQVYRTLAAEEKWVIIGDVVGEVDPEGGSNVWYVRWGFNRWEYTAKSNVTAGPAAPVADCTAAVDAATAPLKVSIAAQGQTIADLQGKIATAAADERERLAVDAGVAEAARIRAL